MALVHGETPHSPALPTSRGMARSAGKSFPGPLLCAGSRREKQEVSGCLPCWRSRSADAHDTREKRAAESRAAGTLQKEVMCRTSLVVQRWRLNTSNVGGPVSILGQGTRSRMPQWKPGTDKLFLKENLLCAEPWARYLDKTPEGHFLISVLKLKRLQLK